MKRIFLFLILFAIPCVAQTPATSTGKAETKGACSPAVTGSKNTFTIACGIGQQQGKQMIDILNKVLANQLDPTVVMAKLDEILKGINPNLHVTTYNCVGQWKSIGPSSSALYDAATGGDVVEYDQMMALNNARSYGALLTKCQSLIQSKPEWLTPRLFCGLAFNGLGNTEKAKEMLHDYDSRTGPPYDDNACRDIDKFLHSRLQ